MVLDSGISDSATSTPAFAVAVAPVGRTFKLSVPSPSSPNVPIPLVPDTPVIGISVFGITEFIVPVAD